MRLLVVSPVVPHTGIAHAGGQYLHRHLARLGAGVTLLAPDVAENRADRELSPESLEVVLAPHVAPSRRSLQLQRDRVAHRMRGPSPLPHVVRGLVASGLVERARQADLVELQWPEYAFLAPLLRGAGVATPVVVVEHDVASDVARRSVHEADDLLDRASATLLGGLHRRRERQALTCADLLLVFKAADEELLGDLGVRTPVQVLDPWLDPPAGSYRDRDPLTVLFTGALWRYENDAGARWLVERVWPLVRADVADARLVLAGDRPSAELQQAAQRAGRVEVTGRLPDLEPVYRRAGVFAAPLFVPGGLKFKVPQAMVHGLPVVTTTAGASGVVEVCPPSALWAVADEPAPFAAALVRALRDPEAAAAAGRRAAGWSREHYSFERSESRLLARYADLVASGPRGGRPRQ